MVKSSSIKKSIFKSYIGISILFVVSILLVSVISFISAKKTLEKLGEDALINKVNMGIQIMDILENQVKKGYITREDAQETFKVKMLGEKQSDGKTRGLNEKLELGVKAYIYALNSQGDEMMHPFKEGENISSVVDDKGNNVTNLIHSEGKNPKNNGIVTYYWKNPEEKKARNKVNAVAYYEPWDWYVNVGCYYEDFYKGIIPTFVKIFILIIFVLVLAAAFIIRTVSKKAKPLEDLTSLVKNIGQGDLTYSININSKDEIGYMSSILNKTSEDIKYIIGDLKKVTSEINEKFGDVNEVTKTTFKASQSITETIEEIASSMNNVESETKLSVDEVLDLTNDIVSIKDSSLMLQEEALKAKGLNNKIVDILQILEEKSNENVELSNLTFNNIKCVEEKSKSIIDIIKVIENISKQINLLSLNASIESARAGEAGRGFSVVANGIKDLSEKTEDATNEIDNILKSLINEVEASSESVNKTRESSESQRDTISETQNALGEVLSFIEKIPSVIHSSLEKVENAYTKKDLVSSSITSVESITKEVSGATEEIATSIEEVNSNILDINNMISHLSNRLDELNEKSNKFKV